MRTKKINFLVLSLFMVSFLILLSCNDDVFIVHGNRYKSMLTVKVNGEDSYYFQSDRGKTYAAINDLYNYSPQKDQRAFVYFSWIPDADENADYGIYIHRIDTVLSKQIAENLYEKNEEVYGNDPVRIDRMWIGGGFLNVRFTTLWGGQEAHFINLIPEEDNAPYTFRFRQNAYNDPKAYQGYAWVAFDLSSLKITGSNEEEIKLTIRVQTYEGLNEYELTYKPGQQDDETDDEERIDPDEDETDMNRFILK